MFKKVLCMLLCLAFVTASFFGCADKTPKTFRDAVSAGKDFVNSNGLKSIKLTCELDKYQISVNGNYDPSAVNGVFSVSIATKDTTYTLNDLIKLYDKTLYVKIPDMSGFSTLFSGDMIFADSYSSIELPDDTFGFGELPDYGGVFLPDVSIYGDLTEEQLEAMGITPELLEKMGSLTNDDGTLNEDALLALSDEEAVAVFGMTAEDLLQYGSQNTWYDDDIEVIYPSTPAFGFTDEDIVGKYIAFKLPETKLEKISSILNDAEEKAYEKLETSDPDDKYQYVAKYTEKNFADMLLSVLDEIKANKTDVVKEIAQLLAEYIGESNLEALVQAYGEEPVSVEDVLSEGLDMFFDEVKPEDIEAKLNGENFDCTLKIAYKPDELFEQASELTASFEDETFTVKSVLTVTNAEPDADFTEKCKTDSDQVIDLKKMLEELFSFAAFDGTYAFEE